MTGHVFSIEDLRYWYPGANRKKLKRIQRLMRSHGLRSGESPHGFMMRYATENLMVGVAQAAAKWLAEKIGKDAND